MVVFSRASVPSASTTTVPLVPPMMLVSTSESNTSVALGSTSIWPSLVNVPVPLPPARLDSSLLPTVASSWPSLVTVPWSMVLFSRASVPSASTTTVPLVPPMMLVSTSESNTSVALGSTSIWPSLVNVPVPLPPARLDSSLLPTVASSWPSLVTVPWSMVLFSRASVPSASTTTVPLVPPMMLVSTSESNTSVALGSTSIWPSLVNVPVPLPPARLDSSLLPTVASSWPSLVTVPWSMVLFSRASVPSASTTTVPLVPPMMLVSTSESNTSVALGSTSIWPSLVNVPVPLPPARLDSSLLPTVASSWPSLVTVPWSMVLFSRASVPSASTSTVPLVPPMMLVSTSESNTSVALGSTSIWPSLVNVPVPLPPARLDSSLLPTVASS